MPPLTETVNNPTPLWSPTKRESHQSFSRRFPLSYEYAARRLRCSFVMRVQKQCHSPTLSLIYITPARHHFPSTSTANTQITHTSIKYIKRIKREGLPEEPIEMAMIRSLAVKLTTVTLFSLVFLSAYGYDGMVGGRTEVKDVKTNEEVQELGRFSVHEYNRSLWHRGNGDGGRELTFVEVVEAQSQVVSGIKYYLKISATQNGATKIFESVVVVKPWVHSKELLNFGPSTSSERKIVPIRF
ncbi:uncharacterized protein LOC132179697 [Corylus avellana]|uniref:uncharacterized protein LOC132179697 n=1 Tax=Corylus avellana TaxID=13451 RepID=UPI00286C551A|nr:uncharacterized protein LOC132179697 [Corylus avellana]